LGLIVDSMNTAGTPLRLNDLHQVLYILDADLGVGAGPDNRLHLQAVALPIVAKRVMRGNEDALSLGNGLNFFDDVAIQLDQTLPVLLVVGLELLGMLGHQVF
jgi:hypothetical protein